MLNIRMMPTASRSSSRRMPSSSTTMYTVAPNSARRRARPPRRRRRIERTGVPARKRFRFTLEDERQLLEAGLLDARHHLRMAVAGVQDGNAAREIDVALALNVPDLAVLGAVDEDLVRMAHAAGNGGFTACVQGGIAGQGVAVHGNPLGCKSCRYCRSRSAPLTYTDSPRLSLHCAVQAACTDKPLVVPVPPAIPCSL